MSIRDGLDLAGIGPTDLWCRYLALGGSLHAAEFALSLVDDPSPLLAPREHDMIAVALNEAFLEVGIATYPVALIRSEPFRAVALRSEALRKQSRLARRRSAELHAATSRIQRGAANVLRHCGREDLATNAQQRALAAESRAQPAAR